MLKALPALTAGLALTATMAISAPSPVPDEKRVYKKVEGDDLELHLFLPEGWKAEDKRGAIVFFFGGGWVGGTPQQFYPHCEALAELGMVAISAQYRTKKSHGTSPFECVEDGKSAVRYLREHASELGIDPGHVAVGGGSAGGHVASSTGTVSGLDIGEVKFSSRPDAMVLYNPVCDTSAGGFGNKKLGDRWRELSPRHNISAKTPPTCIFHGLADTTVPHQNAADFNTAMAEVGRRCELHSYPGAKHGFFNFGRDGGEAYRDTFAKTVAFLESLGFIDKEAK
jgi:acetyl esterase/lipase